MIDTDYERVAAEVLHIDKEIKKKNHIHEIQNAAAVWKMKQLIEETYRRRKNSFL